MNSGAQPLDRATAIEFAIWFRALADTTSPASLAVTTVRVTHMSTNRTAADGDSIISRYSALARTALAGGA
jgi:hypothetical protein